MKLLKVVVYHFPLEVAFEFETSMVGAARVNRHYAVALRSQHVHAQVSHTLERVRHQLHL